mmetsp:Transcript_37571/g.81871  ORF Transcript_37571/g.81871 Transcript_37571/m.81871 type:complete len:130 (-) Transcript_37571:257-646(-)
MQWGYFFAWAAVIFALFWLTGWPVTPMLAGSFGNHYNAKDLTYYSVLYFHYLIGALFFSFLVLGLFRNLIWKDDKGGNRQLAFLLAYSMLIAACFAVGLVHLYSPASSTTAPATPAPSMPPMEAAGEDN